MIVEYATWEVEAALLDAYERWHGPLVEACQDEEGCLAYDVRVDPHDATRRSLFQAWVSPEAFAAHIEFPAHKEMLAGGKPWQASNVVIRRWEDAREYHEVTLEEAKARVASAPDDEGGSASAPRPAHGAVSRSMGTNQLPMVVEYATSEAEVPDFAEYERWLEPLVAACREEEGCLAYETRVDPHDRTRRALFQAWASPEAFAAHIHFPAHKEMLVGGKPWQSRNILIRRWDDTREYHEVTLDEAQSRAGMTH